MVDFGNRHHCSGSILESGIHVLTAAHCVYSRIPGSKPREYEIMEAKALTVLAGVEDIFNPQANFLVNRTVSKIIPFEDYKNQIYYDVAILELSEPFEFRYAFLFLYLTLPARLNKNLSFTVNFTVYCKF